MKDPLSLIVLTGCLCLAFSIGLAWCLTGIKYLELRLLKGIFPGYQNLVKAHVDFAIKAALLFAIYLVFSRLNTKAPQLIISALCAGAILNPGGFIVLSIKPDISSHPLSVFGMVMTISFMSATVGYIGSIWIIVTRIING
ncbi:MAG: hypothetical protein KJ737_26940 [Proteobacteria bacterium]|nr:hypothetical protein [Pseudomonadota bacterium]